MSTNSTDDIQDSINKAKNDFGHVNILIAGKSGVGKSTLINAVFDGDLASTGQGRPITQETREYTKEGIPLSVFDSRGLELANYQAIASELERFIRDRNNSTDPQQHIHIGWICVSEDSRRFEEGESEFLTMLARYMPVVVVITKARSDQGFKAEVQRLAPKARDVVRVRAISETLDEGQVLQPMGLKELIDVTMNLVPEAHKNAFAVAQKVDFEQRVKRAHTIVVASAAGAGVIGATPVPFADAMALIPLQVGMIASISLAFGIKVDKEFLSALVTTTGAGQLVSLSGRALVGSIIKCIPGAGSIIGGVVSAGVAALITGAIGEAYIAALSLLMKGNPTHQPSVDEIRVAFANALAQRRI